jgi:hypothetical protein
MVELRAGMKISRILASTTRLTLRLRVAPADWGRAKLPDEPTKAEALRKLDTEANDRCNEVAIAEKKSSN